MLTILMSTHQTMLVKKLALYMEGGDQSLPMPTYEEVLVCMRLQKGHSSLEESHAMIPISDCIYVHAGVLSGVTDIVVSQELSQGQKGQLQQSCSTSIVTHTVQGP